MSQQKTSGTNPTPPERPGHDVIRALLAQLAAQEDENVRVWNLRDADRREIVAVESARDAALAEVARLREAMDSFCLTIATDAGLFARIVELRGPPEGQP